MIVADTNLVVYGVLPGERAPAADAVRHRDAVWVAPPLAASEILNVLATHVRTGRLHRDQARDAYAAARDLLRLASPDPLDALDLAADRGLSGYDAEFVALARSLGVPLVTDDRRILQACPDLAVALDAFASGP